MDLKPGALVLYKQKPARITAADDKLHLEVHLAGDVRVRPKDVTPLHPGPTPALGALRPPAGDPAEIWELLEGQTMPLSELADLAFGEFTPQTALAVWNWVQDGTYFTGTPELVTPRTPQDIAQRQAEQQARDDAERTWEAFVDGLKRGEVTDRKLLAETEALALGRARKSRALAALGRPETPEAAHALLLHTGAWTPANNPHPARQGVSTKVPEYPLPDLPEEARLDLTHLPAWAIDDEGSSDPDDAISLVPTDAGWRLWVHVADVAALVPPGSPADEDARARGATLYLPEGTIPMLPPGITHTLGLGLHDTSPALSFAVDLDHDFTPTGVDVAPTTVRVTRLTYAQAQARLHEPELRDLAAFARAARERREEAGAVLLDLPEVRVRATDGTVSITPLPPLHSRVVVQEAMMLAGWAAATWADQQGVPLPFAAQDPPLTRVEGDTLPDQWARRKTLTRTRFAPAPGRHAGLGLEAYAQATSPMRRYLDLVVHQQLRAALAGERPLAGRDIAARAAQADMASGSVRSAERTSNRHWTLVYLQQHLQEGDGWTGEGTVVDRRGHVAVVLLPDLALDVHLPLPNDTGETVRLRAASVDLPTLDVRLRVTED